MRYEFVFPTYHSVHQYVQGSQKVTWPDKPRRLSLWEICIFLRTCVDAFLNDALGNNAGVGIGQGKEQDKKQPDKHDEGTLSYTY